MKLHLSQNAGQNAFTAYGEDFVMINDRRHETSLIVLPSQLITNWAPRRVEDLTEADFAELAKMDVEIVLLGTGKTLRFPHPRLTAPLMQARIGCEVMDSQAAARTYNILMGEGRRVAAALLL